MCVTVTTKEVYFISTKKTLFRKRDLKSSKSKNLQQTSQIAIESVTHRLLLDSANNHHFHLAENKTSSSSTSSPFIWSTRNRIFIGKKVSFQCPKCDKNTPKIYFAFFYYRHSIFFSEFALIFSGCKSTTRALVTRVGPAHSLSLRN